MWVISSRKCFLIAMLLAALGVMGSVDGRSSWLYRRPEYRRSRSAVDAPNESEQHSRPISGNVLDSSEGGQSKQVSGEAEGKDDGSDTRGDSLASDEEKSVEQISSVEDVFPPGQGQDGQDVPSFHNAQGGKIDFWNNILNKVNGAATKVYTIAKGAFGSVVCLLRGCRSNGIGGGEGVTTGASGDSEYVTTESGYVATEEPGYAGEVSEAAVETGGQEGPVGELPVAEEEVTTENMP